MPHRRSRVTQLPMIEPDAAGIDVGATQVFVAVPADRDPESIRSFDTFTVELERLADWLQQCGIRTVAMESPVPAQNVGAFLWHSGSIFQPRF